MTIAMIKIVGTVRLKNIINKTRLISGISFSSLLVMKSFSI